VAADRSSDSAARGKDRAVSETGRDRDDPAAIVPGIRVVRAAIAPGRALDAAAGASAGGSRCPISPVSMA
jgi:hypothetical protein